MEKLLRNRKGTECNHGKKILIKKKGGRGREGDEDEIKKFRDNSLPTNCAYVFFHYSDYAKRVSRRSDVISIDF